MARASADRVITALLASLQTAPRTINELAELARSNRLTITKYLDALRRAGLVTRTREGKEFVFRLQPVATRQDTYFDLPLTRSQEARINGLFRRIRQAGVTSKTLAQKLIVTLNERVPLDLPIVWYLYGPMTLKAYDPDRDYQGSLPPKIDRELRQLLAEQHTLPELLERLYAQHPLYTLKKEIEASLDDSEATIKRLRRLVKAAPRNAERDIIYFEGLLLVLTKKREHHPAIPQLFTLLWELIASKYLATQLQQHYDPDLIRRHLGPTLQQRQAIYDQLLDETFDSIAVDAYGERLEAKERKMLWGAEGRGGPVKELSPEERKELFDSFMRHRSEIFREFGLD